MKQILYIIFIPIWMSLGALFPVDDCDQSACSWWDLDNRCETYVWDSNVCCRLCVRDMGQDCDPEATKCRAPAFCLPDMFNSTQFTCQEVTKCAAGEAADSRFGCELYGNSNECECNNIQVCKSDLETSIPNSAFFTYLTKPDCEKMLPVAKVMHNHRCRHARCPIVKQLVCDQDSELITEIDDTFDTHCCKHRPVQCICDHSKCKTPRSCKFGLVVKRLSNGTDQPGNCCPTYECTAAVMDCSTVECGSESAECPADSYRPQPIDIAGQCCPLIQQCSCRPDCLPVTCRMGQRANVTKTGNFVPGTCCDEFVCISDQLNDDLEGTNADIMSDQPYKSHNKGASLLSIAQTSDRSCKSADGLRVYANNQTWHDPSDACSLCHCDGGVAKCKLMECPPLPERCSWEQLPEGECCSVCLGCRTNHGQFLPINATWVQDKCTNCRCLEGGEVSCNQQFCSVQCENPTPVDGQCCDVCEKPSFVTVPPACPSISHCPLRCEFGLAKNELGCFQCLCAVPRVTNQGNALCDALRLQSCTKKCAHGYEHDASGCAVCECSRCPPAHQCYKRCVNGFLTNEQGCPICKCTGKTVQLDENIVAVEDLNRLDMSVMLNISEGLYCVNKANARTYSTGEFWNTNCRQCYCDDGQIFCALIQCAQIDELNCTANDRVKKRPGECCASCASASESLDWDKAHNTDIVPTSTNAMCHAQAFGRLLADGESFHLRCAVCTCRLGVVMCHVQQCPAAACSTPILDKFGCCPRCENDTEQSVERATSTMSSEERIYCKDDFGIAHAPNSQWRVDDCQSCSCSAEGSIDCYKPTCPRRLDCPDKLRYDAHDLCCDVCADDLPSSGMCEHRGTFYTVGELWRDGECRNCTCTSNGQTVCTQLQCPPCDRPIYSTNQCACPLCHDVYQPPATTPQSTGYPGLSDSTWSVSPLSVLAVSSVAGLLVLLVFVMCLWRYHRQQSGQALFVKKAHHGDSPIVGGAKTSLLGHPALGNLHAANNGRLFTDGLPPSEQSAPSCGRASASSTVSTGVCDSEPTASGHDHDETDHLMRHSRVNPRPCAGDPRHRPMSCMV